MVTLTLTLAVTLSLITPNPNAHVLLQLERPYICVFGLALISAERDLVDVTSKYASGTSGAEAAISDARE